MAWRWHPLYRKWFNFFLEPINDNSRRSERCHGQRASTGSNECRLWLFSVISSNRIYFHWLDSVMVNALVSGARDSGFESRSGRSMIPNMVIFDNSFDISCFDIWQVRCANISETIQYLLHLCWVPLQRGNGMARNNWTRDRYWGRWSDHESDD